jgi:hypothetical protein
MADHLKLNVINNCELVSKFMLLSNLYIHKNCFLPMSFYAFLNYLIDFDEIWKIDELDLGEEHKLPFVAKKKKRKGNINTFDKARMSSCFVVAICCYKNWKKRDGTVIYLREHL